MAIQSKICEILPDGYGYVVCVVVDSIFVNMWMARNVGKARKKFSIDYPKMYSEDNNEFNCIQRAHQHTLEMHPSFMFLMLVGGLQYPKITAGLGGIYVLSRIAFAKGYYTGDPDKRKYGTFGMVAMLGLLGNTISFMCHQLRWCGNCSGGCFGRFGR